MPTKMYTKETILKVSCRSKYEAGYFFFFSIKEIEWFGEIIYRNVKITLSKGGKTLNPEVFFLKKERNWVPDSIWVNE